MVEEVDDHRPHQTGMLGCAGSHGERLGMIRRSKKERDYDPEPFFEFCRKNE